MFERLIEILNSQSMTTKHYFKKKQLVPLLFLVSNCTVGYEQCLLPFNFGLDTHGNGIANCQDMDDDYDGILDEVECPPVEVLSAL